MLFLIAGIVFAAIRWFATRPTPIIAIMAGRHYIELSWLGAGVLVCLLYAFLYYIAARFLRLRVSPGLSLLHLLITLSPIIGLGQLHFVGVRTEQSPASYSRVPAFLGLNAFTLLVVSGLIFLAAIGVSWLSKRPSPSC
jgi:hypothetical protein